MAELLLYGGGGGVAAAAEEDRIHEALLENLLVVYHHLDDGPPPPAKDQQQIQTWMQEIRNYYYYHDDAEDTTTFIGVLQQEPTNNAHNGDDNMALVKTNNKEYYERGLERAIRDWKQIVAEQKLTSTPPQQHDQAVTTTNPPKVQQKKKSFSLLDQMNQGLLWGCPPTRITTEELQQVGASTTTSPAERLMVLQKIQHLDDILLDWKDIVLPLLQQGIINDKDMVDDAQPLIQDFWMLHRKWFHQGRASAEYLEIQWDLCQNVLAAIVKLDTTAESNKNVCSWMMLKEDSFTDMQDYLIDLWNLWYEMWLDLMQQPIGVQEENGPLGSMARMVLRLIRDMIFDGNSSWDDDSDRLVLCPAHFLAFVDPTAVWFRAWLVRLTPVELMRVANLDDLCPDLWHRAMQEETPVLCLEQPTTLQLMRVALRQHSISIIGSILTCTRLQWFPSACVWQNGNVNLKPQTPLTWDKLMQDCASMAVLSTTKDRHQSYLDLLTQYNGITSEQTSHLFALFLQVGDITGSLQFDQDLVKPLASICAKAIEIILLGVLISGVLDNVDSSSLLTQCQIRTRKKEQTSFDKLLANVLIGLERDSSR